MENYLLSFRREILETVGVVAFLSPNIFCKGWKTCLWEYFLDSIGVALMETIAKE